MICKATLPTAKIIKFNALLRELYNQNKEEAKEGILSGYGVQSTKDLTEPQLDKILAGLETEKGKRQTDAPPEIRKLRSTALTLLTKIGVDTTNWSRVNNYLEEPRICGKRLYDCDKTELDALIKKLHAVKAEYDRRKKEETHWASNN